MLPNQANAFGNVHGGEIMKMMDNAAGVVATRHTRSNVVTARVEGIDFYQPIYVGNLVTLAARLTFVSKHTMEVEIEVTAEDLATGHRTHALTAYFVMVALDQEGRPKEVPTLILRSERERRSFEAGQRRYQERKARLRAGDGP
jgi:acyl-CoA hydrolase